MPPGAALTTTSLLTVGALVVGELGVGELVVGVVEGAGVVGVVDGAGVVGAGEGVVVGFGAMTVKLAELRATLRPVASKKRATTLCAPTLSFDRSSGLAVPSGAVPIRSYGGVSSVSVRAVAVPWSRTNVTLSTGLPAVTNTYARPARAAPSRFVAGDRSGSAATMIGRRVRAEASGMSVVAAKTATAAVSATAATTRKRTGEI